MYKQNIETISYGEHFHRECQVPIVIQAVNKTVILMSLLTSFWRFLHHILCNFVLIYANNVKDHFFQCSHRSQGLFTGGSIEDNHNGISRLVCHSCHDGDDDEEYNDDDEKYLLCR